MPPSLPTGTVSQPSAGTRTFPPDSDADRARASAGPAQPSQRPQLQSPPTSRPEMSPGAVVPRREHDVAVSREHERVAELERENEVLRDYIETQATERQAVIERYERLLDRRETAPRPASPEASTAGVVDTVRSVAERLRSRLAERLGFE